MLSSVRNFFLALFISLIVCGIGAYFLVGFINKNIEELTGPPKPTESLNTDENNIKNTGEKNPDDDPEKDTSEFTALIFGIDNGKSQLNEKKEADTIILLNINAKTKTLMILPLPCDMKIAVKGFTLRLGAVYGEYDAEMLMRTIWSYTGMKIDYYCVFDYESLGKVFDILGEIEYTVPMDMKYEPKPYYITTAPPPDPTAETTQPPKIDPDNTTEPTTDVEIINLESGEQMIDGAKAIQLLRYKGYSNENYGRITTQIDFLKEVIRQKITFENLGNAKELYAEIKESIVATNMDEKDFENYANTIFNLSDYTIKDEIYPGEPRYENGVSFYVPDLIRAVKTFKIYRRNEYTEPMTE